MRSGVEMRGNRCGGDVVEVANRVAIGCACLRRLRLLPDRAGEARRYRYANAARRSCATGWRARPWQNARSRRLRRALRIALSVTNSGSPGPTPTPTRPPAHSPPRASALTAAAVMALPPMRPRTIRNGVPRGSAASAAFELGGANEANRHAQNSRGLRCASIEHLKQAVECGRRIADGDHGAFEPIRPKVQRRSRARGAELLGERRDAGIAQRADHLVVAPAAAPASRRAPPSRHRTGSARRPRAHFAPRQRGRRRKQSAAPHRPDRRHGSCARRRRLPRP